MSSHSKTNHPDRSDCEPTAGGTTVAALIRAVRQVLGNRGDEPPSDLSPDYRLAELGFDSLDLAEVIVLLELEIGSEIRIGGGENLESIRDLVRVVRPESR